MKFASRMIPLVSVLREDHDDLYERLEGLVCRKHKSVGPHHVVEFHCRDTLLASPRTHAQQMGCPSLARCQDYVRKRGNPRAAPQLTLASNRAGGRLTRYQRRLDRYIDSITLQRAVRHLDEFNLVHGHVRVGRFLSVDDAVF